MKGLLLEIQPMAEMSCLPAEVILLRPLHSLLPSATTKTAVSLIL